MRIPILSVAFALLVSVSAVNAGSIDQFPLPRTGTEAPLAVAPADSFAWVASGERAAIAKVSFNGDVLRVFTLPSNYPFVIAGDPSDNSVWYVTYTNLGHLTSTGSITEYPLNGFRQPSDVILGPDNNIWIAMSDSIVRVTRTGQIREFSVRDLGLDPYRMAVGSDGNIWITCHYAVVVAKMTPNGDLTAYRNVTSGEYINAIAAGPDTNMYFSCNSGELHMITLDGTPSLVTTFSNPLATGPTAGLTTSYGGPTRPARPVFVTDCKATIRSRERWGRTTCPLPSSSM